MIKTILKGGAFYRAVGISVIGINITQSAAALEYNPIYSQSQQLSVQSRVDDVYYLQPHNSYAPREGGEALADWLNQGLRSLEIDVLGVLAR
ncbi:hypothetical protein [Shewanella surugensis]|uniref:Uncharacterized protein n=1 Tax=Shewanella surugensis TaxID=212020 RepID=A0ABT0L729_9GAMM|nr:hypothetical protein [Shewanella surugensis]MCL1123499.1 hypothetical protein [Shewanella surugensis]